MREREGDRETDRRTEKAVGPDSAGGRSWKDTGESAAKRGDIKSHVRERKVRSPRVSRGLEECVCARARVCASEHPHL